MQGNHTHICLNCATPFTPKRDTSGRWCNLRCYLDYRKSMSLTPEHILARLMKKIDSSGGPNACWPWTGSVSGGYGSALWGESLTTSHRAVYMAIHGEVPRDVFIRHKCDNPLCCNPDHLEPGTHQDNMDDMTSRNRRVRGKGEENPRAKLTWDKVRSMRSECRGRPLKDIAKEYEVSIPTVSNILRGATWREG